jgi:hypothetical protein
MKLFEFSSHSDWRFKESMTCGAQFRRQRIRMSPV